jgi:hypothetical protein
MRFDILVAILLLFCLFLPPLSQTNRDLSNIDSNHLLVYYAYDSIELIE